LYITAAQCRAARALIGWSREALAEHSLVGLRTLIDFERGARKPQLRTNLDIRRALEGGGVIFIDEDDKEGPGVRLQKQGPDVLPETA
jgi:transcriptional regulator with XRE-family HTH domain